MSTIFEWNVEEFDYFLESCGTDPLTSYISKYFSIPGPILEGGCGSGRYVKYLHDRGYDCRGIEYNKTTVENVKRRCREDVLSG